MVALGVALGVSQGVIKNSYFLIIDRHGGYVAGTERLGVGNVAIIAVYCDRFGVCLGVWLCGVQCLYQITSV